jgi:hypothetical protein
MNLLPVTAIERLSLLFTIFAAVNIFVIEPIRYLFAAVKGLFSVPLIWL